MSESSYSTSPLALPLMAVVASGCSVWEDVLLLRERRLLRSLEAKAQDNCLDTVWLHSWEPQRYADSIVVISYSHQYCGVHPLRSVIGDAMRVFLSVEYSKFLV